MGWLDAEHNLGSLSEVLVYTWLPNPKYPILEYIETPNQCTQ